MSVNGLMRAGSAVIVSGRAAEIALAAMALAARARRVNGLPESPAVREIAAALHAAVLSGSGRTDIPVGVGPASLGMAPSIPLTEAARRLGVSDRQARRLAGRLGGRKIAGRWLVDETALTEHLEGQTWGS